MKFPYPLPLNSGAFLEEEGMEEEFDYIRSHECNNKINHVPIAASPKGIYFCYNFSYDA
jgi:hypothetical protein